MKMRKGVDAVITKETRCVGRIGIDYENRADTIAGRMDGSLPIMNKGLPWGKWARFPYLIKHKGELFLRIYPKRDPKIVYRINGQVCRVEEIQDLCLASEFRDDVSPCKVIRVGDIRQIRSGERIK